MGTVHKVADFSGHVSSKCLVLFSLTTDFFSPSQRLLICHYWHLNDSSQNMRAKAKCLLCLESRVKATFSYSNLHDMTNSLLDISEVTVQLQEWRATLNLSV